MVDLVSRCKRCGRKLTNAKSISRGYGEVCWKKVRDENKVTLYSFEEEKKDEKMSRM